MLGDLEVLTKAGGLSMHLLSNASPIMRLLRLLPSIPYLSCMSRQQRVCIGAMLLGHQLKQMLTLQS